MGLASNPAGTLYGWTSSVYDRSGAVAGTVSASPYTKTFPGTWADDGQHICKDQCLVVIVGHIHRGDLELPQQDLQVGTVLLPQSLIEIGEGLVHQEERRISGNTTPQGHPLLLTTGQCGRLPIQEVLELDPHDVRAENNLGLLFEAEARTNDALEAYRKAIAWQQGSPRPSEQPYLNLGILLLEQERVEEAVGALEKGTELAPNDATCHFRLGIAYSHMNRLQEAQAELARAELLEPQNARIHYQLGRVYKQMHQMDRAKAEFARTEELQNGAAGALPRQVPVKPQ